MHEKQDNHMVYESSHGQWVWKPTPVREWACLAESYTPGQQSGKTGWFQYSEPWAAKPCVQSSESARAVSNHSTGCVFVFQVRSEVIATYALCGFANFGSLGLVIGGLSKNASYGQFIWQANPQVNMQRNRLWVKLSSIRGWAAALPKTQHPTVHGRAPRGVRALAWRYSERG